MNQRTTLEVIAPTVEEAISQGLAQLGLTADAVSVEVLDAGNKGLFGLGRPQVRVRLTVNPAGGVMDVQTEAAPNPQPEPKRVEIKPQPAPVKSSPPAKEVEPQPEHDALLDRTESVVSKLLHLLDLQAQVSAHYGSTERDGRRNINVDIRGSDLSVLIGRRSETLSAFQYVASLSVHPVQVSMTAKRPRGIDRFHPSPFFAHRLWSVLLMTGLRPHLPFVHNV